MCHLQNITSPQKSQKKSQKQLNFTRKNTKSENTKSI